MKGFNFVEIDHDTHPIFVEKQKEPSKIEIKKPAPGTFHLYAQFGFIPFLKSSSFLFCAKQNATDGFLQSMNHPPRPHPPLPHTRMIR